MALDVPVYFHGNFKMTILLLVLSVILFQAPSATTSSTTPPSTFSVTSSITTSSPSTTQASSPKTLTETTTSSPVEASSTPHSTVVTSASPSTTNFVLTSPTSIATKPPLWCATTADCNPTWFCVRNRCQCLMIIHYNNGTHCVPRSSPGESCDSTTQCVQDALCFDGECTCNDAYFNTTDGRCEERSGAGQRCDENKLCVQNSKCQDFRCVCDTGYVHMRNSCVLKNPPGGPCAGHEDCVEHAFCENQTVCSCEDDFFSFNHTCQSVYELAPADVRVMSYGTTSITVSWTPPSICTAIYCKYNVTYGIKTERPNFLLTNKISSMLNDLEADQTYAITVMTLLNVSADQEVTSRNVSIEQTTMNSQPEELTVNPSSDSASVSFVEPENETNRLFQIVVKGGKYFERCVVLFRNVSSCPGENSTRRRNCEAVTTDDEKTIAHNITGLLPYSNYNVTVLMVKCEENSPIESGPAVFHFMTKTAVPGPVRNLTVNTNSSHLCLSWNPPDVNPGPLDYRYEIFDLVIQRRLQIIDDRLPYDTVPGPVRNLTVNTNSSHLCLSWNPPDVNPGLLDYRYEIFDLVIQRRLQIIDDRLPYDTDFKTTILQQRLPSGFWEYAVNVIATTTAGRNGTTAEFITNRRNPTRIALSTESCCTYTQGKCSAVKPETYSTVYLTWRDQIPESRNTRLTRYEVSDGEGMRATEPITEYLTNASDAQYRRRNGTHHCFYATVPVGTTKSFQVDTYDDEDKIVSTSEVKVSRPIRVPPGWDSSKKVKIIKTSSTTITVSFSDRGFFSNNAFGPITDRFLLVKESSLCTFPVNVHRLLHNNSFYWKAGSGLHLVILPDIADSEYVIGSGGTCEGFCNGELSSGTTYCFAGYVCTIKGCRQSKRFAGTTKEGALITIVVILVCLIILVGVFVAIATMLWKYKRYDSRALNLPLTFRPGVDLSKIPREQPVVLSQMAVRVTELHCDSNRLFSAQYEDLVKVSPKHPNNAANLDDNKQKNRYVDVLPFDKSRVTLKMVDNEETSDYINASFLPGYNWDKEYVACQGPLPGTVDDFWRMIWEQNVSIIVMVTSIKENGKVKCEEYWPVEVQDPKQYGNIVVENISFSSLSTFNVNILKLRIDQVEQTVKQFHFLNWRDMSADVERNDIISFVRTVRSYMRPDMAGPMVVHCSAGVGRTGTFICLDYIIQFIENHDLQEKIDIYEYVLRLRDNRPRMVQTESQYIFIHDCARQLVEEKQAALDKLSEEEVTYENTEMCTVDLEETEDVKSFIYENAELNSTEELVQQTEL